MIDLLAQAIQAHGGLDRWTALRTLSAIVATSGDLLLLKGMNDHPAACSVRMELHRPCVFIDSFPRAGHCAEFTAERVAIKSEAGKVIAQRRDPRSSFARHDLRTCWDPLHHAYFEGYSAWTRMIAPFSLAMTGVECHEISPLRERGEIWRGLRARLPPGLASHCSQEDYYFGPDWLIRRHDYALEIAGGATVAEYVFDPVVVGGIVIATRGRVYLRQADGTAMSDALMLSIRLSELRVSENGF